MARMPWTGGETESLPDDGAVRALPPGGLGAPGPVGHRDVVPWR